MSDEQAIERIMNAILRKDSWMNRTAARRYAKTAWGEVTKMEAELILGQRKGTDSAATIIGDGCE